MRFGLVLGGGGVVGTSWTIGALAGASEALGLDFADADVTVATSAGACVAPRLLARDPLDRMVEDQRAPLADVADGGWMGSFDQDLMVEIFQRWVGSQADEEAGRYIGDRALRASRKDGEAWVQVIAPLVPGSWPDADLRIQSVDCATGERVTFTASSGVDIARAAAASSAVPGIIPPISIGDSSYMDGGVWSLTNADRMIHESPERVFILAAQAGGGFLAPAAVASLERETAALRAAGIDVHTLVPREGYAELGLNQMDPALRAPGVELGLRDGRDWALELAATLQ